MKQTNIKSNLKLKAKSKVKVIEKQFLQPAKEVLSRAYLLILCLPYLAMARDFLSSVENASNEIRQIISVVGILALMVAGLCFYWSKKLGIEKLSAAVIGTVVFATASTVFTLFYKAFN